MPNIGTVNICELFPRRGPKLILLVALGADVCIYIYIYLYIVHIIYMCVCVFEILFRIVDTCPGIGGQICILHRTSFWILLASTGFSHILAWSGKEKSPLQTRRSGLELQEILYQWVDDLEII